MTRLSSSLLLVWTLIIATTTSCCLAFTTLPPPSVMVTVPTATATQVTAVSSTKSKLEEKESASLMSLVTTSITTAAVMMTTSFPTVAQAVTEVIDDGYEYGAVDAPIGIAVAGGVLAILTALLPVALRGGEEAFDEIKDRDQDTFGKRNNDVLSKRK